MIALVYGAAASGKSACAEQLALQLHETATLKAGTEPCNCALIYLANMFAAGDEAIHRIKRHRALRAHKGFTTLEIPRGLAQGASSVPRARRVTLLLEDLDSLVANEMFFEDKSATLPEDGGLGKGGVKKAAPGNDTLLSAALGNPTLAANSSSQNSLPSVSAAKDITRAVLEGIAAWETRRAQVNVVGNEVGGDEYASDEVRLYQEVLGACSCALAAHTQLVIECMAGIEHTLKGARP